jgi:hypothetical protein
MTTSKWRYNKSGYWWICSNRKKDVESYYRIDVLEDGMFSIEYSDGWLVTGEEETTFRTLAEAKQHCEAIEAQAMRPSAFSGEDC